MFADLNEAVSKGMAVAFHELTDPLLAEAPSRAPSPTLNTGLVLSSRSTSALNSASTSLSR